MIHLQLTCGLLLCSLLVFGQSQSREQKAAHQQKQNTMAQTNISSGTDFTPQDLALFKRCLALAQEALDAGDQPFGSILVDANQNIIAEARNRINEKNVLAHPEFELAEWAMEHLSLAERKQATMYTTGEHCPMCAGAHAWAEIGSLYYLSSAKQLGQWLSELGVAEAPIAFIPSEEIMKNTTIKGPATGSLVEQIKHMHQQYYQQQ